ncbi:MAG: UDP-glucose 4-epimerase GalE [Candidatus Sumerlaeia bacterium]|nr:UDP-glucose 4-epimerase GalE [Candidatus Sumerlaeia bacterium]
MSILVVGGAGYIGSVTVEHLLAAGEAVVVLDDLSRGHREAVSPQATLVHGSMADADRLRRLFRDHSIDAVMHFAAHSLVPESMANPLVYWENNVAAGLVLVREMIAAGVTRFVFSSTAATYGEPGRIPITEDTPTIPTNTYGLTKLTFERILADAGRAHGLRAVCLRYFNACGATETRGEDHHPETHLIPLVLEVAAGKRPSIKIFGDDYPTRDGTCVRDYIHVVDLAQAHLLALAHLRRGGEPRIYNLGNGEGFTVKEIVAIAREVTGHPIPVEFAPRRPGDPATLVASSDRIAADLDWRPQRGDIREIIQSAWQWHRHHPQGYASSSH